MTGAVVFEVEPVGVIVSHNSSCSTNIREDSGMQVGLGGLVSGRLRV